MQWKWGEEGEQLGLASIASPASVKNELQLAPREWKRVRTRAEDDGLRVIERWRGRGVGAAKGGPNASCCRETSLGRRESLIQTKETKRDDEGRRRTSARTFARCSFSSTTSLASTYHTLFASRILAKHPLQPFRAFPSLYRALSRAKHASTMAAVAGRSKRNLVAVVGTTGVGKSQLAIELALAIPSFALQESTGGPTAGEIINSDSMQVYRGLDIITNKATEEEMKGVPHHLMGFLSPGEEYRIGEFQRDAVDKVRPGRASCSPARSSSLGALARSKSLITTLLFPSSWAERRTTFSTSSSQTNSSPTLRNLRDPRPLPLSLPTPPLLNSSQSQPRTYPTSPPPSETRSYPSPTSSSASSTSTPRSPQHPSLPNSRLPSPSNSSPNPSRPRKGSPRHFTRRWVTSIRRARRGGIGGTSARCGGRWRSLGRGGGGKTFWMRRH